MVPLQEGLPRSVAGDSAIEEGSVVMDIKREPLAAVKAVKADLTGVQLRRLEEARDRLSAMPLHRGTPLEPADEKELVAQLARVSDEMVRSRSLVTSDAKKRGPSTSTSTSAMSASTPCASSFSTMASFHRKNLK